MDKFIKILTELTNNLGKYNNLIEVFVNSTSPLVWQFLKNEKDFVESLKRAGGISESALKRYAKILSGETTNIKSFFQTNRKTFENFLQEVNKISSKKNETIKDLQDFLDAISMASDVEEWHSNLEYIEQEISKYKSFLENFSGINSEIIKAKLKELQLEKWNFIKKIDLYKYEENVRKKIAEGIKKAYPEELLREDFKHKRTRAIYENLTGGTELAFLTGIYKFKKVQDTFIDTKANTFKAQILSYTFSQIASLLKNTFVTFGGVITKASVFIYFLTRIFNLIDRTREVAFKTWFFSENWGMSYKKAYTFLGNVFKNLSGARSLAIDLTKYTDELIESLNELAVISIIPQNFFDKFLANFQRTTNTVATFGYSIKEASNIVAEFYNVFGNIGLSLSEMIIASKRFYALTEETLGAFKNLAISTAKEFGLYFSKETTKFVLSVFEKVKKNLISGFKDLIPYAQTIGLKMTESLVRMPFLYQAGLSMFAEGGVKGLGLYKTKPFQTILKGISGVFQTIRNQRFETEEMRDLVLASTLGNFFGEDIAKIYFHATDEQSRVIRNLIEQFVSGNITEENFVKLQEAIEEQRKRSEIYLKNINSLLEQFLNIFKNIEHFLFFRLPKIIYNAIISIFRK
ncbi:MAG: hypothetical protein QXD43_01635 [Candidatus Aenigmatarchaeota archaeon]